MQMYFQSYLSRIKKKYGKMSVTSNGKKININ